MMRRLPLLLHVGTAAAFGLRAPAPASAIRAPAMMSPRFCDRLGTRMMCAEAPAAEAVKAAPEEPGPFALLDVRVGKIVEAWEHPDSEKLWCERIDVGEEEPREIASGLRAYAGSYMRAL